MTSEAERKYTIFRRKVARKYKRSEEPMICLCCRREISPEQRDKLDFEAIEPSKGQYNFMCEECFRDLRGYIQREGIRDGL